MMTITAGDLKPDLEITLADARADANFSLVDAADCHIYGVVNGILKVDDVATSITVAPDNKSAVVKREWVAGETDTTGRMWISVEVTWTDGDTQTFPEDTPLRLDIRPAAASA